MSGIAGLPTGFVIPSLDGLDFTRHDTLIHTILPLNITIIVAVVITVSLRLYSRLAISGHVGYDDCVFNTPSIKVSRADQNRADAFRSCAHITCCFSRAEQSLIETRFLQSRYLLSVYLVRPVPMP